MLAGGEQPFHDLAVQRVGHDHAHHIDVIGVGHRLPAGLRPFVAEAAGGVGGQVTVGVRDSHQPDVRKTLPEHRRSRAVSGGVRAACHPGTDDGHSQSRTCHVFFPFQGSFQAL
jgi:hypothetical protein